MRRGRLLRFGLVALGGLGAAAGCASLLGLDEVTYRGRDGASDPSDAGADTFVLGVDDAGRACQCVPAAPIQWQGPVLLDEVAACSAPWGKSEGDLYADLDGGPAACTCSCAGTFNGSGCTLANGDLATCPMGGCNANLTMTVGTCNATSQACGSFQIGVNGSTSCSRNADASVPRASWGRTAHVCATGALVGAAGCPPDKPLCVPLAATGSTCVVRDGDQGCVNAGYARKQLFYRDASDTRACGACTCVREAGPCQVSYFDAQSPQTCNGAPNARSSDTTACLDVGDNYGVRLERLAPNCIADGGIPAGALVPSGPVTACCLP